MLRLTSHLSSALRATNHHILRPTRTLKGLVVGVPKESLAGEHRVALVPSNVTKLIKAGAVVNIEKDAGVLSGYSNEQYTAAGAKLLGADDVWKSPVIAKIRPPTDDEALRIGNRTIVSIIQPKTNTVLMDKLVEQKVPLTPLTPKPVPMATDTTCTQATVLSMDSLLRTLSRGQAFDVLSSQANVAGYRAGTVPLCPYTPIPSYHIPHITHI